MPPDAEMLYMQEVERMEGYGEESYPAKVELCFRHKFYNAIICLSSISLFLSLFEFYFHLKCTCLQWPDSLINYIINVLQYLNVYIPCNI